MEVSQKGEIETNATDADVAFDLLSDGCCCCFFWGGGGGGVYVFFFNRGKGAQQASLVGRGEENTEVGKDGI